MGPGVSLNGVPWREYPLYEPYRTLLQTHGEQKVLTDLLPGQTVAMPDGCCGEARSLAITRPDISAMIRLRKEEGV
jgi:Fe-S oxidoreductase